MRASIDTVNNFIFSTKKKIVKDKFNKNLWSDQTAWILFYFQQLDFIFNNLTVIYEQI